MKQVLFLDIDGVLNSRASVIAEDFLGAPTIDEVTDLFGDELSLLRYESERLSKVSLGCLAYILTALPDLEIIVHSTWGSLYALEDIKKIFKAVKVPNIIIDRMSKVTPKKLSSQKCHEIKWALQEIQESEDVVYIILENHNVDPDGQWFGDNQYIVDDDIGLGYKDAIQVIKHFNPDFKEPTIFM